MLFYLLEARYGMILEISHSCVFMQITLPFCILFSLKTIRNFKKRKKEKEKCKTNDLLITCHWVDIDSYWPHLEDFSQWYLYNLDLQISQWCICCHYAWVHPMDLLLVAFLSFHLFPHYWLLRKVRSLHNMSKINNLCLKWELCFDFFSVIL